MNAIYKSLSMLMLFFISQTTFAVGVLIAAPDRVDMAHDFKRNLVYISNDNQVLRYDVIDNVMLAPIQTDGLLGGMDISPDGDTLAVADSVRSATEVWVHLFELNNGDVQRVSFPRAFMEGGTFTVAYAGDGTLLITSEFDGSGWVPMRQYNPVNGNTTVLASVRQNSMITGSGDLNTIAYAESNISSGPFGIFNVLTQQVIPGNTTGWFNYEIGVSHDSTQYSVPTYGGTFVYDANFSKIATIGTYAGPQPIGVVYHPAENLVYYAWRGSSEVRAYDTQTMTQSGAHDVGYVFVHNGNHAFVNGRLKTAADGSKLMASVGGGVQYIELYDALSANGQSITMDENASVQMTLDAAVGNGGTITYSILDTPQHGTLSGAGANVVYTPEADYNGSDRFIFNARYGKANMQAVVDIIINPVNSAPRAVDDVVQLTQKKIVIPVLANDSDSEGDALIITSITPPAFGRAYIVNNSTEILYRARRGSVASDSFTYTASDGNGAFSTATVTIIY